MPPLAVMQRRLAMGVGAVALGLAALFFAQVSDHAQQLFSSLAGRWPYATLVTTPLIFAGVAYITQTVARDARGSGIPQVIAASREPDRIAGSPLVSLRVAGAKLGLTITMLFAGASVGREGPTVQVSASIMAVVHKLFRVRITPGVIIAGGAAGVAAAFNTPLAGVAFAIEELAAAYEQRVAVLVMAAVMIAGFVTLGIAGDYVYLGVVRQALDLKATILVTPVAAIVGGLAGGLFSRLVLGLLKPGHPLMVRARARPLLFAAACGLVVAAIGIATAGATWGTGYEATKWLVEGHPLSIWFAPGKFIATLATTMSGTPGGVFAPSLAVGAGIGNVIAPLFPSQPAGAIVVIAMVSYFVGVVRAPITAVIIVSEATANRGMILPLFAAALIAEATSALVCRERLYHGLAKPFMRTEDPPEKPA